MRKFNLLILFINFLISCSIGGCKALKSSSADTGNAVSIIEKANEADIKQIHVLKLARAEGVIFPASYSKRILENQKYWKNIVFFTPDSKLIEKADAAMAEQYCAALIKFDEAGIKDLLEREPNQERDSIRQKLKETHARFIKNCKKWQKELPYTYRQFIGYINAAGEKMIYINLLKLKGDSSGLGSLFHSSWISGFDGWYEAHTETLHFNVDKSLITVNEDI